VFINRVTFTEGCLTVAHIRMINYIQWLTSCVRYWYIFLTLNEKVLHVKYCCI